MYWQCICPRPWNVGFCTFGSSLNKYKDLLLIQLTLSRIQFIYTFLFLTILCIYHLQVSDLRKENQWGIIFVITRISLCMLLAWVQMTKEFLRSQCLLSQIYMTDKVIDTILRKLILRHLYVMKMKYIIKIVNKQKMPHCPNNLQMRLPRSICTNADRPVICGVGI